MFIIIIDTMWYRALPGRAGLCPAGAVQWIHLHIYIYIYIYIYTYTHTCVYSIYYVGCYIHMCIEREDFQTTGTGTWSHLKSSFKNTCCLESLQSNVYITSLGQGLRWSGNCSFCEACFGAVLCFDVICSALPCCALMLCDVTWCDVSCTCCVM